MRSFAIAALVGTVSAAPAVQFAAGDAPTCYVNAYGQTVVQFDTNVHPDFKCSHSGNACSCTLQHPTHHDGSCREFDHTSGKNFKIDGDCTNSGKNHIDGGWSGWTYGTCSKSCGTGTQSMTRSCTNPAPFHNDFVNGAECTADGSSASSSQSCNTHACPVDGTWSAWTYGTCSTSCGAGTKSGTRTCDGRDHGGADCAGLATGQFDCDHGPCPVHCATSAFDAWSTCSKSCGTGTQSRSRTITTTAEHGGYVCPYLAETQNCNTGACAVDGTWSSYSSYSTCSKSCGTGTQSRTRTCDGKAYGGKACVGSTTDTRNCNTHDCPVDGAWSSYSYGACSANCGTGTQTGTRTCDGQANGGADCAGSPTTTQNCNTHECPVDGVWSGWTYGTCSATCGTGTQSMTRTCDGQAHGGADCVGSPTSSQSCNTESCPFINSVVLKVSGGNNGSAQGLTRCTGECDGDGQCADGLKCFERSNGEPIPGCDVSTAPGQDWDYCYDPNTTTQYK